MSAVAPGAAKGIVLLVEDEFDTRELLGRAVERAGYSCRTAADAETALSLAGGTEPPDVVVTDVVLGSDDRGGLSLMGKLREIGIRAPVIVITAYADVDKVKTALNSGAAHFLEKPFRAADLVEAIDRVRAKDGGAEPIAARVFDQAHLTDKEQVVARHLLGGLSSTEIATLLGNSPKTIRQHVSQIYAKCGVGSRAELFRRVFVG